jgi:hypothetical protein
MRNVLRGPYPELPEDSPALPRPPHISGLALLRGVFLSTGFVRSATDLGLVAAGGGFILMFGASTLLAYSVTYGLERILGGSVPLVAMYTYALPATSPDPYLIWRIALYGIRFLAFLTVLRLSPVSGYHGAEHKVVNAIELTGSLDEETVRRMPRQHVRCGTNLLAGLGPFLLAIMPDVRIDLTTLVTLLVVGFLARRTIGYLIQTVFTTKEPTTAQLRLGIESGRQLMERWYGTPYRPTSPAERLWARGLPQMLVGLAIGLVCMRGGSLLVYWLIKQGL